MHSGAIQYGEPTIGSGLSNLDTHTEILLTEQVISGPVCYKPAVKHDLISINTKLNLCNF